MRIRIYSNPEKYSNYLTKGVESSQRGDSNVAQRGKETIDSSIGKKS